MTEPNKISLLNDTLRVSGKGGQIHFAGGLAQADAIEQLVVLQAVRDFDAFTEDNDPHGEHDFGRFELDGQAYNWKIDYYDLAEENGSPDPTDPMVTVRVLTIIYAEDY